MYVSSKVKIAEFLHVSIISITKEHILFLKQNGGTESIPNFSLFPQCRAGIETQSKSWCMGLVSMFRKNCQTKLWN